ncbi:hypothetical protein WR25_10249 isoform C [Diploscapter pachys]|uniref:Trehalase n=1 Tax=Diploscapter pachys TaxID=2018661 RepID=A0A2A2JAG0_9BILA|nr:hypothetical protein WR25_10249 isoform C [Diploscapter pachys]
MSRLYESIGCIFFLEILLLLFSSSQILGSPLPETVENDNASAVTTRSIDDTDANRVGNELNVQTAEDKEIAKLIEADLFTGSIPVCDENSAPGRSMVYCSGRLLQAVMAVKLHEDSKTFVDRPMKENLTGQIVIDAFNAKFPQNISQLNYSDVKAFVDEHFDLEGQELDICDLPDWNPSPTLLNLINDSKYREFAQDLNAIWIQLCRKVNPMVEHEPERFSLFYVPYSFVIPGGRFREFYYWDAYWIIKGLLASNMTATAKNMVLNFAYIVEQHGFIPNGGRIYYLKRSQPPLFAPMVYEYYEATHDIETLRQLAPTIEKEINFWMQNRSVSITVDNQNYTMYQYRTLANTPRPESFREDVTTARNVNNITEKRKLFQNLGSAAESGWDFSSRWFADGKTLSTIQITDILPVDLNAFICYNMRILSFIYGETGQTFTSFRKNRAIFSGDTIKKDAWYNSFRKFQDDFQKMFYVANSSGWFDYNLKSRSHNVDFYLSTAVPLFTQCYDVLNTRMTEGVYNMMQKNGVFNFAGLPTRFVEYLDSRNSFLGDSRKISNIMSNC